MDFKRKTLRAVIAALSTTILLSGFAVAAQPVVDIDTGAMVRNVNTPQPTPWRPTEAEEEQPLDLLRRYRLSLRAGDSVAAYRLLTPGLRADLSVAENAEIDRTRRWIADPISLTRMTWYPNPAGAEPGLYVAMDFASRGSDGSFHCGYVMAFRPAEETEFLISRIDTASFERAAVESDDFARILAQLPCWLGETVPTSLNPR